jgi:CRP/FNR family transcriptional regulator, cyclic AMP receptor protein
LAAKIIAMKIKTTDCETCANANCFVKWCSHQWVQQVDFLKCQTIYKKHQNIINEGLTVFGVFFIQRGKVKVFSTGINGKEQIVRFASDGHILGHRGIGADVYPISAATMEDSCLCFIDNDTLNEMFFANPKFSIELMMYYSRELRKLENRVKYIAQMNIREKTAETLLLLLEIFGLDEHNEINVSFTRDEIACTAGSTRQQVTMQLSEFEKDGIIEKHGKRIALNKIEGLRRLINKFNLHKIPANNLYAFPENDTLIANY